MISVQKVWFMFWRTKTQQKIIFLCLCLMDMIWAREKWNYIASEIPYWKETFFLLEKLHCHWEKSVPHFCLSLGLMKTKAQVRITAFMTTKYACASQGKKKKELQIFFFSLLSFYKQIVLYDVTQYFHVITEKESLL